MSLQLATFAGVLVLVIGLYWIFVVFPEQRAHLQLHRRLKGDVARRIKRLGMLKDPERLSQVGPLDRMLARATRVVTPLRETIEQSGLRLTVGTLLLASGCIGLGVYLLVKFLTFLTLPAVAAGLLASSVPYLYVRRVRHKRLDKFEEQFPEAIDLIARALRSGHAFTTGLAMVADEVADPIGTEFRLLHDRQNFGMPLPDAMRDFGRRVPLIDARFFVTAVLTQRETGGNLAEVLDNLASVIRDRFRVKRQVRVLTAHGRITGWILAGLPPALAVALFVIAPGHLNILINDPLGVQMIMGALTLQVIGTLVIRKLVDVPY